MHDAKQRFRGVSAFGEELIEVVPCTQRGVPRAGRPAEMSALRKAGRRDVSLGRIFEGHLNGVQLVARCGSARQRTRLESDVAGGHLFGVWNTEDGDGVSIAGAAGRFVLSGAKTWASGAGSVSRAIVTARRADGTQQMCLIRMERVVTGIDSSCWHPLGMQESDSFRVSFDGVELDAEDLIGEGGDYERQPWFFGGALRFAAVQTGTLERLLAETVAYLAERERDGDAFQRARVAQIRIAVESAVQWIEAGCDAWEAFDAEETPARELRVVDVADMARTAVERAALTTSELVIRSVGARGLVEPSPFARLTRDLQMYLRQPAPDAVLTRIGAATFRDAAAARSAASASSTGTAGNVPR